MIEFQKPPAIEVSYSPFRYERHDLMVYETERQLTIAGSKIIQYWDSVVSFGVNILMEAEMTREPVLFESHDTDGTQVRYMVRSKGVQLDRFLQPVDLFLFVKPEGDQNYHPSSIAVATYRGEKQRYSRLVAFVVRYDEGDIIQTSFHFFYGKLVSLEQVGRYQSLFRAKNPGIHAEDEANFSARKRESWPLGRGNLFPAFNQTDSVGFFNVQNMASGENVLNVEAGYKSEDIQTLHLYQNLGGQLVKTRNLRVADPLNSEIELIDIAPDGTIYTSEPFSLPEAIKRMANFEPATSS